MLEIATLLFCIVAIAMGHRIWLAPQRNIERAVDRIEFRQKMEGIVARNRIARIEANMRADV